MRPDAECARYCANPDNHNGPLRRSCSCQTHAAYAGPSMQSLRLPPETVNDSNAAQTGSSLWDGH
jgi:hypothetical protein